MPKYEFNKIDPIFQVSTLLKDDAIEKSMFLNQKLRQEKEEKRRQGKAFDCVRIATLISNPDLLRSRGQCGSMVWLSESLQA